MSAFVHESAYADEGAHIGERTKIWHFCHISAGAEIGTDCSLGQNVFVARGVKIGHHVKIQNNVSIYEGVVLEDYVFCGPSMVFTNVRDNPCRRRRTARTAGPAGSGRHGLASRPVGSPCSPIHGGAMEGHASSRRPMRDARRGGHGAAKIASGGDDPDKRSRPGLVCVEA